MNDKLTKKQKALASAVNLHRKTLLKKYSSSRLAQYVTGVRIPDFETAAYIATLAGVDVETIAYRKENI